MMALDASVKFGVTAANDNAPKVVAGTGHLVVPPHPDAAPAKPSITNPAPGSIGAWVISLFKKVA